METITQKNFSGERALYGAQGLRFVDCVFGDGESPLKEAQDLQLQGDLFRWKYPLWYCRNVTAKDCTWFDMARAGVWYTTDLTVDHALIQAPKNFRRCDRLRLKDVTFTNAAETLWACRNVRLQNVAAKGDYFAMNCENLEIEAQTLDGNNSFDGTKNVTIRNSTLLTKDAFWNSDNVTVYDSFISGEYLGWNSTNLTLVNCTIESLQGMCYIENLKMVNCKLVNTTLSFEYSDVQAQITSKIDSVFNPRSGKISAPAIDELIVEADKVDPAAAQIDCPQIARRSDRPEWMREKI